MVLNPVVTRYTGRTEVPKGLRKNLSVHSFTEANSKDCLLPIVPQVIIKRIHLEANKFSDINKLFGEAMLPLQLLTWKYVFYC